MNFIPSLGIDQVPSATRLHQRMDADADTLLPVMYAQSIEFLVEAKVPVSGLSTGHVALDIDVFPMDNSKTQKEGVSRIYKGHDGSARSRQLVGPNRSTRPLGKPPRRQTCGPVQPL